MSEQTPTFYEALESISKLVGVKVDDIFDDLYEDVELARLAYIKRIEDKKAAVEDEQAPDFANVNYWPPSGTREDLEEALNKLGVNGNRFHEDAFNQTLADLKKAEKNVFEKPSEPVTESEYLGNEDDVEPVGDLWEIVLRGEWGSEQFRADHVEFGNGYGDSDGTLNAYIDDSVVFHAPAGTYLYARKLAE